MPDKALQPTAHVAPFHLPAVSSAMTFRNLTRPRSRRSSSALSSPTSSRPTRNWSRDCYAPLSFAKTSSAFSFNNLGKPDINMLTGVI